MNPENPINDGLVEPIGIRKPQKSIKMDRSKKSGRRAKQKPDNSRQSSLVVQSDHSYSGSVNSKSMAASCCLENPALVSIFSQRGSP